MFDDLLISMFKRRPISHDVLKGENMCVSRMLVYRPSFLTYTNSPQRRYHLAQNASFGFHRLIHTHRAQVYNSRGEIVGTRERGERERKEGERYRETAKGKGGRERDKQAHCLGER